MSNVTKLPDSYSKHALSNNYKLLNINEQAIEDAKTDVSKLFDSLDLQNATGHTLDLFGNIVGQTRGTANDAQYRALILTKIGTILGDGTLPAVMKNVKNIFQCSKGEIVIKDGAGDCEVVITKIPYAALANTDLTSAQALEVIKSLLSPCVTINKDVEFLGTFEFGENENEYGNGFDRGHLGLLYGDDANESTLSL